MAKGSEEINNFMVSCFYSILYSEEKSLEAMSNGKLTLKEIHVIEAVYKTMETGDNNFSNIANMLKVTLGTLTTAFSKLEQKGYLIKERHPHDKRIFYVIPTRLAELINNEHKAWHQRLVDGVVKTLSDDELQHFVVALKQLATFFKTPGSLDK